METKTRGTETMSVADLKPGDPVAIGCDIGGYILSQVAKVTPTQIAAGRHRFDRETGRQIGGGRKEYLYVITPEIEQKVAEAANRKARLEASHRKTQEEMKADPRWPLLNRFRNGDFEPWGRLSLEQLEAIAAILDSVKP